MRAEFVKRFDKDGDGKLSEEERAAARKAFQDRGRRARQRPAGDGSSSGRGRERDDDDADDTKSSESSDGDNPSEQIPSEKAVGSQPAESSPPIVVAVPETTPVETAPVEVQQESPGEVPEPEPGS
jgi:hypothetical protein